jgi:nitrogenase molybdenum-iron protein alpha/beta subunit
MRRYLPIEPDGLTGALLAIEGIRDGAAVLNGPTGCKAYHSALSDKQLARGDGYKRLLYRREFYFGQPRIPATYLDRDDYIFGAAEKLDRMLKTVVNEGQALIAVINSPGAALIGDDLARLVAQTAQASEHVARAACVVVENAGFSDTAAHGFQQAMMAAIGHLCPAPLPAVAKTVNLLGLSIWHKHWEGGIIELQRLLGLCGIRVNTVVSAGTTVSELRQLPSAGCNAVVYDEYGTRLAEWLKERCGTPYVSPLGAPIGFEATGRWVQAVARALDADPIPALEAIVDARRRAFSVLMGWSGLIDLPKGVTFGLHAAPSIALPLTRWLYDYLGMIPVAVTVTSPSDPALIERLRAYLESIDCIDAWQAVMEDVVPEVVVSEDNVIARIKEAARPQGVRVVGVSLSGHAYIDLTPKSLLGAQGALYLIEQIINGLQERMSR